MAEQETKQQERRNTADSPVTWFERSEPEWVAALRKTAFQSFADMAWPTPEDEEWRRTDVTSLDFGRYVPSGETPSADRKSAEIPQGHSGIARFVGQACTAIRLLPELERKGVRFQTLTDAVASQNGSGSIVRDLLTHGVDHAADRFETWHYGQWTHGVFLHVPKFVEITEPFTLEFSEIGNGTLSTPHVIVVLEEGARALVVQRISNGDSDDVFCNEGADLRIADAAGLEFIRIQDLSYASRYVNHSFATIGRDAAFKHLEVAFGTRLYKSRLEAAIVGTGGDIDLNGVYMGHKKQHFDIGTIQRHEAPNANSRAFYKGGVRQKARTIYRGLIEVDQPAAKTDAYLTNKNLILNDGARSDSIPMLKINTNDVKCSHGSTTGKINEEQLTYLMSRGFPRAEAERMLIQAFFDDVIVQSHPSVREELRAMVQSRLVE